MYLCSKIMTDKMIIGFDAKRIVRNRTGLGSYARTLVSDLAGRDDILLRLYAPDAGYDDLRCQVPERENLTYCYPSSQASHRFIPPFGEARWGFSPLASIRKSYWRSRGIVADLRRDSVQLYHGLSGELPVGISRSGIKSVVTIHDLIFLRHPEFYHWIDTKIYARKFRQTVREADHIIAISECTKRDILAFSSVDERKISVIYQSYAPHFKQPSDPVGSPSAPATPVGACPLFPDGSDQPYLLSVGTIERRKNILLAVKALALLPSNLKLVVIGRHTPYADEVRAYAERHGLAHRLLMLHDVSNQQLPPYYRRAEAFVYPSVYEGFGIPIIEAISSGLPVVACTGSCLEEAGGPASLYVAPTDAEGLAAAVRQCLHGTAGRAERIRQSQAYIRRFEGTDVASQVAAVYRRLLG